MLKRAQTESDVRSLDEVSPWTPSIASRATYELTPLRMLQVMQQERACGTGQIFHLVRVQPEADWRHPKIRAAARDGAKDFESADDLTILQRNGWHPQGRANTIVAPLSIVDDATHEAIAVIVEHCI